MSLLRNPDTCRFLNSQGEEEKEGAEAEREGEGERDGIIIIVHCEYRSMQPLSNQG